MAITLISPSPIANFPAEQPLEQRLVLSGISWEDMESIDTAFSNAGVKLFYLDGYLEIVTVSNEQEKTKRTIGLLLEAYLRAKNIRFYGKGGPTLGEAGKKGRKEPDESYNISVDRSDPDLVIEVILTSGGLNKLAFYHRLGVAEVWFWEDGVLDIYHWQEEGYAKSDRSALLPDLNIKLFSKYITYTDQYDAVTEFMMALRA